MCPVLEDGHLCADKHAVLHQRIRFWMRNEADFVQECFRVFSKDAEGCIPADEIKYELILGTIFLLL